MLPPFPIVRKNLQWPFAAGDFFDFNFFGAKRKIWSVRIGIESERGRKPASRCMRGGETFEPVTILDEDH